jgi:uncharacterized SAM-binding protein YcdF (DUF218 family)
MRKSLWILVLLLLLASFAAMAARSGSYLVLDQPQRSDAILVLAGETDRRPARALELLAQGYAPIVVVDVPAAARLYDRTQFEVAQQWVSSLPERAAVRLCPTKGLSTRDESRDAAPCIAQAGARSVLLVTSDFHTRRALTIFRTEYPSITFSVAAARDETQFGTAWWKHRQWAKVNLDEWLRLIWWKAVDRWR